MGSLIDRGFKPATLKGAIAEAVDERRQSVVYFAERDGLVKIEASGSLGQRLAELNRGDTALPGMLIKPVKLLATMPGGRPMERSLHELFAGRHREANWFLLDAQLAALIEAVAAAGGADVQAEMDRAQRDALAAGSGTSSAGRISRFDLEAIFRGDPALTWHEVAARLAELAPDRVAGMTAEIASVQVRALGVSSVSVKRAGRVTRGIRREHLDGGG